MISIQGKGVSTGVAMGPLYYYQRAKSVIRRITVADVVAEWERFKAAQKKAIEQLGELYEKALKEAGEEAAFLFETHQMMAEDDDYVEAIEGLIKEGKLNAEAAVTDTAAQFADMFAQMDDTYMQARAADVRDVSGRIIGNLTGVAQGGIDSDVPVVLADNTKSGHGGTYDQPNGGDNARMVRAWLDWQLKGNKVHEALFLQGQLDGYDGWTIKHKNKF